MAEGHSSVKPDSVISEADTARELLNIVGNVQRTSCKLKISHIRPFSTDRKSWRSRMSTHGKSKGKEWTGLWWFCFIRDPDTDWNEHKIIKAVSLRATCETALWRRWNWAACCNINFPLLSQIIWLSSLLAPHYWQPVAVAPFRHGVFSILFLFIYLLLN